MYELAKETIPVDVPKRHRRRRASFLPLRVRVELVCDGGPSEDVKQLTCSADAYELLREHAARWDRERFVSIILDTKNRVLGVDEVSVGSLGASLVHPREVFKAVILANAASFIIAHNHPSGDPAPSPEDRRVTERLKRGAELLGIPLLDHVIIGADRCYSFADTGW